MTAMAATMGGFHTDVTTSSWGKDFANGKQLSAEAVETARGEWKEHLDATWGGIGKGIYKAAGWLQDIAGAAMMGSAVTAVIPPVAALIEGSELAVYFAASAVQGMVRTGAENRAITKAEGTKKDQGGLMRTLVNSFKALSPFD